MPQFQSPVDRRDPDGLLRRANVLLDQQEKSLQEELAAFDRRLAEAAGGSQTIAAAVKTKLLLDLRQLMSDSLAGAAVARRSNDSRVDLPPLK